ncbi:hypothetical protein PENTCL1PPCAC_17349, partial [Pristionchus entomophagus]
GTSKCVFRKHEKFMCRRCRYDRCLEIGLGSISCAEIILPSHKNILQKIKTHYAYSVSRRLQSEQHLAKVLTLNRFSDNEDLFMCNIDFFYLNYPFI